MRLEQLGIESDYLIPQINKLNSRFRSPVNINKEAPTYHQFTKLLKLFYEEIVEKRYGEYYLSKITPGDTRHFAIMNLFLQGFNILSICRMAGHEELGSPANYYTHAKHYATSAVYKLAQRKIEGDIGSTMKDGFFGWRDKQVRRAKHNLDDVIEKWRKVDYGYCKDTEGFPFNCVEDCRLCQRYYLFKPSVNEWQKGIDWFESLSKQLEEDASNTLNLMAMVSAGTFNTIKDLEPMTENESKSLSIMFFKYLDHKAIIDGRILEEKLKEIYLNEEK
jgi:hypothetical protein